MPSGSSKSMSIASPCCSKDRTIVQQLDGSSIELADSNQTPHSDDVERGNVVEGEQETTLPRADGGKNAWLFLAGCFVFEALVWGFPFSFGVFQSFYTSHPPFNDHPSGIAIIGTCSTGVMYFFAPISLYALEAWPSIRRLSSILGLMITVSALLASSFATRVWHLILTQGMLYGIGGSLLYSPTMFYLDEWFIRRKGLAFGIMWAGTGTSGVIFPFLLTALLNAYGFRTTLRIWSLTMLILCTPLIHFVKARVPVPSPSPPRRPISLSFLTSRVFLFFQLGNILESLGFFLPSIYLPSYARALHLPPTTCSLLLAFLNGSSVAGAIVMGHLCDLFPVTFIIALSTFGASLSVFLLWGLASSLPSLLLFAALYGLSAGGFSAIWTGMMRAVQRAHPHATLATLMGLFSAGRGIGAVLSGPLSELLLAAEPLRGAPAAYASPYGPLILFTGVSALLDLVCLGAGRHRT